MVGLLQPLSREFVIVGEDGRPTDYFIRWAQQRQQDIGQAVTNEQVLAKIQEWAAARQITAGAVLSGGGNLSADITIDHEASFVVPGTYGSSTKSAVITVDEFGHVQDVTEADISGGGGGGGRSFCGLYGYDNNASDTTNFATKGTVVIARQDITVASIWGKLSISAGQTVVGVVADIASPTGAIGARISSTGTITYDAGNIYQGDLLTPLTFTAGSYIFVGFTRTDGNGTSALSIPGAPVTRMFAPVIDTRYQIRFPLNPLVSGSVSPSANTPDNYALALGGTYD